MRVYVCVRERERDAERDTEREEESGEVVEGGKDER